MSTSVEETVKITGDIPLATPADPAMVFNTVADHKLFQMDWTYRRRLIFHVVWFCGGMIVLIVLLLFICMIRGQDVQINISNIIQTIIWTISLLAGSVISSYVFGVAYDNKTARNGLSNLASNMVNNNSKAPLK